MNSETKASINQSSQERVFQNFFDILGHFGGNQPVRLNE